MVRVKNTLMQLKNLSKLEQENAKKFANMVQIEKNCLDPYKYCKMF